MSLISLRSSPRRRGRLRACAVVALQTVFATAVVAATPDSLHEKEALATSIAASVAAGDFEALSRRIDRAAASQERFADGMWRSSFAYADVGTAMGRRFRDPKEWDGALARLRRAASRDPAAWFLVVEALSARAWQVRGPELASSVPDDAWPVFRRYESEARDVLDRHKRALSGRPAWYALRMRMATELGEDPAFAQHLFDEGLARHPRYHALYFARLRYLSPRWWGNGSREPALDFLAQVAALQGETAAENLYARLLWIANVGGYPLLHSPRVDVDAFRASALALAEAYPDQWNVQMMFLMACETSGKAETRALGAKVVQPLLPTLWGNNLPLYDSCRDWSEGRLPMFIIRDHDGDVTTQIVIQ